MKKLLRIVFPVILALLVVFSVVWYLFEYDRDFTRDVLLREARLNDARGNTVISAWLYKLAYAHSGNDEAVALELANQYKSEKNYTKAEVTLSRAIASSPSVDLYAALCRTYVEQDKLMDAVALLNNIPDPQLKSQLDALRPSAPTSPQESGLYNTYVNVELTSSSGSLYYTTNGEYPSIRSIPYTEPIRLSAGETIIYCISVDQQGLVSPVSVLGYTVGGVVEPAVFMDAYMEYAIRDAINVSRTAELFTNELWTLTEFTVPEGTRTLEDLKLLTHLESLTIRNMQLSSLSDLLSLKELKSLDLTGCQFPPSELAVLAQLPSLTKLVISDCGLSTIADLQEVSGLTYLDISNNTIRNLEPLSGMEDLRELYMQHNALSSLDALLSLYNLEKLNISFNAVSSLAPLGVCVRLTWLDASNNQLSNVNGLTTLPLLSSLSLNYNNLSDVSALGACYQLRELSINNNQIYDITSFASMMSLEVFDFSYNNISVLPAWQQGGSLRIIQGSYNSVTSVQVLANMPNLTYVSLDYNSLTDVRALANCSNLVQVNVYGNKVDPDGVRELTDHSIIVNYDPT